MHTGKELEAHQVEKGRSCCDSDVPQVGSARSDLTRVVKVNRRKTKRSQNETILCVRVCVCVWPHFLSRVNLVHIVI